MGSGGMGQGGTAAAEEVVEEAVAEGSEDLDSAPGPFLQDQEG